MCEIQVRHFVGRNAVEVTVIDLEAGDDQPDPPAPEHRALGNPHKSGYLEHVRAQRCRQVRPSIDRLARHHERVTLGDRLDRHEYSAHIVLQDEVTG